MINLKFFMSIAFAAVNAGLLICTPRTSDAAPINLTGGAVDAPLDITSWLLTNQELHFNGGHYVVRIPSAGPGITQASLVDWRLSDMGSTGYSTASNPTINYKGAISGNGVLTVKSAFDTTKPGYGRLFSGGALVFSSMTQGQHWGVEGHASGGNAPAALIIEENATVAFVFPGERDRPSEYGTPITQAFPRSDVLSRNIINNGHLFSATENAWSSITGTGISSFAYFGGDRGSLGSGNVDAHYSGEAFHVANGLKIEGRAVFKDQSNGLPTKLVTRGLATFSPTSSMSVLSDSYNAQSHRKNVPVNMFNWGLNIQLWWNGVHQFTGMFLPTTASKSFLETALPSDAVKGVYSYNGPGMAFGRVVNINNRSTLMMGDGREVVTEGDGVTNNVWLQGNPFNTLLSTSNFVYKAPGRDAQAIAYVYSGTYRINHNMNAKVDAKKGVVQGIRNNVWTNLYLLDPKNYNQGAAKANHAIVTTPVFFGGLTLIEKNCVLQLGDGSVGNNVAQKILVFSDGSSASYPYSDSGGNGLVITKGNRKWLQHSSLNDAAYEILNHGRLVVANTAGATNATAMGASEEVAAWMSANQLDGIGGEGSVEQLGTLALVLGSLDGHKNTYSGGTTIGANATLIVGSPDAFGIAKQKAPDSGRVVNRGTVKASTAIRVISVPGDYIQ